MHSVSFRTPCPAAPWFLGAGAAFPAQSSAQRDVLRLSAPRRWGVWGEIVVLASFTFRVSTPHPFGHCGSVQSSRVYPTGASLSHVQTPYSLFLFKVRDLRGPGGKR